MAVSVASVFRPPRAIAVYLFVLALVALIPAFTFSAVLLQRNNEAQDKVVETLITGSTRSIMEAADREILGNLSTLKVLGESDQLRSGNLESFYKQIERALGGSNTYVYVLDSNFDTLLSTRTSFGAPKVKSNSPEAAQEALATRGPVITGVVLGAVSKRLVFNVLYPEYGTAVGDVVLGISRDASSLNAALNADKLPDGWKVAMVDADGKVIEASDGADTPGQAFALADITAVGTTPGLVTLRVGSDTYRAALRKSAISGWTLIAWAPNSVIAQPLVDAVWSLAVGGLLLAMVVVLIVYWVTLQIGRSVRGLESDARRLGAGQPVTARAYPISEIVTVSAALEEASKRRQQAEAEVRYLMRELAHRSKNQMTVIAAMAKQTARGAETVPEFVQNFEKRIFGLAKSTDLLLANGAVGVDLRELLTSQIDPFCPTDGTRVQIAGEPVRLNNQSAQILGMAAHELATNAVKYGAFVTERGTLAVTWTRTADTLDIDWRETSPDARPPSERRGFGTAVLENMVGRSLGATVERSVHPDGLQWHFSIPLAGIDPSSGPEGRTAPGA